MADIHVRKVDEASITVDCAEESTAADLNTYFTFHTQIWQRRGPKKIKRPFDCPHRLYNLKTHRLPAGLLRYVLAFSQERNLTVEVEEGLNVLANFSVEEASRFIKELNPHAGGKPIEAHEHQILGLAKTVRYKRILLQSPTASGKSLLIYSIIKYLLQKQGGGCKRGLVIVPTVSLVSQMAGDFMDYSNGKMGGKVQMIHEGLSSVVTCPVTVSTWQSIYDMPKTWYEQFDFVIGDEAHGFKASSLNHIMSSLKNARYRIGTTGTLDDMKLHKLVIEGHFGPHSKLVSTKQLQDKGLIADLVIKCLIFQYTDVEISNLWTSIRRLKSAGDHMGAYRAEMDFLIGSTKRNKFIKNLASSLKGNKLILFQNLDHGQHLTDLLAGVEQVYLVNGATEAATREEVRKLAERMTDVVIVASYGVYSTGVNIKNLNHVIFASPSKSKIRVLQSIGRGLRLKEGKTFVTLYDIADDLRKVDTVNGDLVNSAMKAYVERLKFYKEEDWKLSSYLIRL